MSLKQWVVVLSLGFLTGCSTVGYAFKRFQEWGNKVNDDVSDCVK